MVTSKAAQGAVVGMLSEGCCLRYVCEASGDAFFSGDFSGDVDMPVSKWMTRKSAAVRSDIPSMTLSVDNPHRQPSCAQPPRRCRACGWTSRLRARWR